MESIDDSFDPYRESLVHEISEKIHRVDGSSSSSPSSDADSGDERNRRPAFVKPNKGPEIQFENLVDESSSGSITTDLFSWKKNKIASAALLVGATVVWILFVFVEYHLITLICHSTILAIGIAFLCSNVSIIFNRKPLLFREFHLPKETLIEVFTGFCNEVDNVISVLIDIIAVRDLKRFLKVIAFLWVVSVVGSFCSFITLSYILLVFRGTAPALWDKYGDKAAELADQTIAVIKKTYTMLEAKAASKIPKGRMSKMKIS